MSMKRIWAVFLRYFYYFAKLDSISEIFYWPTVDILLWGMTSIWMQQSQTGVPDIALVILTALVFWQIIWRSNYEITVNILQEFWNRNMVNLFSTPLKLSEWMIASMLVGMVKIAITLVYSSALVWGFYSLNIFQIGWTIVPFIGLLIMSGWFMGYLSGGIMVYFGQRLQMLAWMTPYVFAPFSAVFYPLSILPTWAQWIAKCLPTTYIFEGMRLALTKNVFSYEIFWKSLILNVIFLAFSLVFFKVMFEKSRNKGLARLE